MQARGRGFVLIRNQSAEQGARANDHGCHEPCSEQHGSRQPRSWLILNVSQKKTMNTGHHITKEARAVHESREAATQTWNNLVREIRSARWVATSWLGIL